MALRTEYILTLMTGGAEFQFTLDVTTEHTALEVEAARRFLQWG